MSGARRTAIIGAMNGIVCELDRALGRVSECAGSRCAFWVDSHCVVAGLRSDWDANPSLAVTLHQMRAGLASPSARTLIPPGLRD